MKKVFFVIGLLVFVNSICLAQMAGSQVLSRSSNLREPATGNGNLKTNQNRMYSIESNVLLNVKPDSYIAVFGFDRLGSTSENSNSQVNEVFDEFVKDLMKLGISRSDIYVDFITQTTTIVDQTTRAFQTKKTISIKYKDKNLFEKLVTLAANRSIFDLIKVDFIVSNTEEIRAKLFEEAGKIIKAKHEKYKNLFELTLIPKSLAIEKYDAFFPGERYVKTQKSFYYNPISSKSFDKVINPVSIEPMVQFTLYLRMDYDTRAKEETKPQNCNLQLKC